MAWRDVALLPLAQIQECTPKQGKPPSSTRSGYEITHLCVSKAGVLKKGSWTDRLSITLPSYSSKFAVCGGREPLDDVAAWWVKYTISRMSDDRSLANAGFGRSNCLLARSSPIHPQHTRRPRSKPTTTTTLEYTKSARRCIPLMRASDGRSLRRGG